VGFTRAGVWFDGIGDPVGGWLLGLLDEAGSKVVPRCVGVGDFRLSRWDRDGAMLLLDEEERARGGPVVVGGSRVGGVVVTPLRVLLFVFLAVLGLVVAGCGDDDGDQLATEEFFLEIGVLDKDYTAASEALEAELDEAMENIPLGVEVPAASLEEAVEAWLIWAEGGVVAMEDFVNGIEQLNAPDDLVEFQDRAVSTGRETTDSLNDWVTALDDITTQDEFVDSFNPVGEAFERFNDLCYEAQGLADDAGVDVTYNCDDDE
jgi:hypothetical protein